MFLESLKANLVHGMTDRRTCRKQIDFVRQWPFQELVQELPLYIYLVVATILYNSPGQRPKGVLDKQFRGCTGQMAPVG